MVRYKTTRARIRQDIDRAINALDHVLKYYARLAVIFKEHGREREAKAFEGLASQLIIHQELLKGVKDTI